MSTTQGTSSVRDELAAMGVVDGILVGRFVAALTAAVASDWPSPWAAAGICVATTRPKVASAANAIDKRDLRFM